MNARILSLDSDEHRAVQSLLPWHANGTLDAAERARVDAHLGECARCQADVEFQRLLRASSVTAPSGDVDRGWVALRARLDLPARAAKARPPAPRSGWPAPRWLPFALGLQAVLVAVLATAWFALPHQDEYRTLGTVPAAPAANALVVFRPDATEAEIREALRAGDARLVGGPTVTDAYLLRLPEPGAASLARLRAQRAVARVESLEGEPAK